MINPDIFFGAGDGGPIWTDQLEDFQGNPLDLTGKTVEARFRTVDQTTDLLYDDVAIDGDPTLGNIAWTPTTPPPPGLYHFNWIVNRGASDQITVPDDRYLIMQVLPTP